VTCLARYCETESSHPDQQPSAHIHGIHRVPEDHPKYCRRKCCRCRQFGVDPLSRSPTTGSGRDGTNYRNSFSSNDIGIASEYAYETADVSRTIEANVAIRNCDGFHLLGAGDKLKANTTKWNHRSGIYAPNAIDLGATWRRGTGRTHNARRSSVREHRDGNRHDLVHPNG